PESLLRKLDMLTPNETEAAILSTGTAVYEGDIHGLVDNLKQRTHVANLIVTHGDKGVYYDLDGTRGMQAACKVEAVDTTAAGDCFNAAVAVRWAEGAPLTEAIQFAIRAAALSVSRFGAQTSLPMRSEVEGWVD
ncbi:MAG: ribokinase, partial [Paenibacillus sp.]|nr:ribokinase [Paenibacillus sp.]